MMVVTFLIIVLSAIASGIMLAAIRVNYKQKAVEKNHFQNSKAKDIKDMSTEELLKHLGEVAKIPIKFEKMRIDNIRCTINYHFVSTIDALKYFHIDINKYEEDIIGSRIWLECPMTSLASENCWFYISPTRMGNDVLIDIEWTEIFPDKIIRHALGNIYNYSIFRNSIFGSTTQPSTTYFDLVTKLLIPDEEKEEDD